MTSYQELLSRKKIVFESKGLEIDRNDIHPVLFDFQKDLVKWALKKGRSAIFADTGLGKTFMQLEWARLTGETTIIIAPLSIAKQTEQEAHKIGIEINYIRKMADAKEGINITNYEMIEHLDDDFFGAVVLDESSILKSINGKIKTKLIEMFKQTAYKLCCTATPAPNDVAEMANHADFLGIMTRKEMLSAFFVHDNEWRLKKHAIQPFYRWLASWGMAIKTPSNLGYSDDGYILPKINMMPEFVDSDYRPDGELFFTGLKGISDRAKIRKSTVDARVDKIAEIVNNSDEQWLVWCGLNDEAAKAHKLIPDSVNVQGSDSTDKKIQEIQDFQSEKIRVLITKPKIAGFGMNFQNAHNMAFVGLNDSWESYYQCIRRSYRFGQKHEVNVHIVLADIEKGIYENIQKKEEVAKEMTDSLIENVKEYEKDSISEVTKEWDYKKNEIETDKYKIMLGDSCERLKEVESGSIGLSVYSPPFLSLYTYSPTERDLGNCKNDKDFFDQYNYIIDELMRVTMPGRNTVVHVANIASTLQEDGFIGLKDFRGDVIRAYQNRGWIYHGEVTIDKNPQIQAIRTHAKGLLFAQKNKDSAWLRSGLADYILVFRKPGDNPKPIKSEITNEEWIQYAHPVWYGIRETDVLNVRIAKEHNDERHMCPLQLGTIERCIKLWSDRTDTVLSPFMGIGSEGFEALKLGRKFIGIELKESYFKTAHKNIRQASGEGQQTLLK